MIRHELLAFSGNNVLFVDWQLQKSTNATCTDALDVEGSKFLVITHHVGTNAFFLSLLKLLYTLVLKEYNTSLFSYHRFNRIYRAWSFGDSCNLPTTENIYRISIWKLLLNSCDLEIKLNTINSESCPRILSHQRIYSGYLVYFAFADRNIKNNEENTKFYSFKFRKPPTQCVWLFI